MCEVIDPTGYGADPSHPVVFWMVYAIESVDLDIKDVADNDEATKGAVVVRNYDSNEAPRKEIDIATQPLSWPGNLKLTWSSKVKVYDAATGGNLKTSPYVFSGGADGTLWVQGDSASSTMRDVEIKLTPEPCDTISDTVNFTVLWVTVTGRYSGSVSSDNSRYEAYMRYVMPLGDDTLGFHRYLLAPYVLGLGREFVGTVAPSDFDPTSINAGSKVYLGRILDSSYQYDDQIVLSSTIGPIEDTGPPEWRDDDPQSGGSNGKIYDLDFPGLAPSFGDSDYIARSRMNFTESAGFYEASASVPVRCSEFLQEYSRQTLRKTGNEETHAASGGNATTLWDTQRTWSTNEWAPGLVKIISGKGAGQVRYVVSNTAVTLTVAPGWDAGGTPDATSVYDVINQTTWTQWTDVTGDNQGGDGTTNTTWNLQ